MGQVGLVDQEEEEEESDDDMGFAMFDDDVPLQGDDDGADLQQGDGDGESADDEDDKFMEEEALRELLKKRATKVPYKFAKATREWCEKGYYDDHVPSVPVNQFWIDYLEHASGPFLSSVSRWKGIRMRMMI